MLFQSARFLSALATDITVGLDSWVDVSGQQQRSQEKVTVTSQDQLEVLRRLEDCEDPHSETVQAGNLVSLGQGCWLVALPSPLSVSAVFTGSY